MIRLILGQKDLRNVLSGQKSVWGLGLTLTGHVRSCYKNGHVSAFAVAWASMMEVESELKIELEK